MHSLPPSQDNGDACINLGTLLTADINAKLFRSAIRRLQSRFDIYASTCPAPFIAPGLIVTPEIRIQSERYLPMADIASVFNRLYCSALSYPPILSSTPFHKALSWADTFVELPPYLQFSANPALLLEKLLADRDLLTKFLFASFLPRRFYGGFRRYPEQQNFIREWLGQQQRPLRCLDAACGTGEDSYGLANLLIDCGYNAEVMQIEGWTIEPLEVWTATHRSFPHDRQREARFREETFELYERGDHSRIHFRCADLTNPPPAEPFDLILCNGLLGGPILHDPHIVKKVAADLAEILAPDGILLAADSFHSGWKQQYPQQIPRILLEANGLQIFEAGEGIGGLKSDLQVISCLGHAHSGLRSPSPR